VLILIRLKSFILKEIRDFAEVLILKDLAGARGIAAEGDFAGWRIIVSLWEQVPVLILRLYYHISYRLSNENNNNRTLNNLTNNTSTDWAAEGRIHRFFTHCVGERVASNLAAI
jgi:hypothetical protein